MYCNKVYNYSSKWDILILLSGMEIKFEVEIDAIFLVKSCTINVACVIGDLQHLVIARIFFDSLCFHTGVWNYLCVQ